MLVIVSKQLEHALSYLFLCEPVDNLSSCIHALDVSRSVQGDETTWANVLTVRSDTVSAEMPGEVRTAKVEKNAGRTTRAPKRRWGAVAWIGLA
jgi:hypothetical protein